MRESGNTMPNVKSREYTIWKIGEGKSVEDVPLRSYSG